MARGKSKGGLEHLYRRANELLSQPTLTTEVVRELRDIRDEVAKATSASKEGRKENGGPIIRENRADKKRARVPPPAHGEYVPYPWLDDPSFFEVLNAKREFAEHRTDTVPARADYDAMWQQSCTPDEFRLTHHQLFLRNYISPHTPYNGLLVFHGTGVGKSCGAIAIAEQFKDRKVFVITRPALESGFKANIYDVSATPRRPDGSFDFERVTQCTGTSYPDRIPDRQSMTREQFEARIARLIRNKYEFMGPGTFTHLVAAMFAPMPDGTIDENAARAKIRKKFSHSMIIVDEAHHLRGEDKKPAIPALRRVLEIADDVKLVLLTATPMFNRASDVVPLINLLRINDKAKPIREQDVFDASGSITPQGEVVFKRAIRGYVSFMRGEMPFSFPLRLWPSINQDPSVLKRAPSINVKNEAIPERDRIHTLELCGSRMLPDGPQHDAYVAFERTVVQMLTKRGKKKRFGKRAVGVDDDDDAEDTQEDYEDVEDEGEDDGEDDGDDDGVDDGEDDGEDEGGDEGEDEGDYSMTGRASKYRRLMHAGQHICNIVYPVTAGVSYGRAAFNNVFKRVGGGGGRGVQLQYRSGMPPMLTRHYLDRYAPKMGTIVDRALRSEGVVMVYSRWIWSGLVPLAMALEHAGVERFGAPPLLVGSTAAKRTPWKYAIISGTRDVATDIETIVERMGDPENADGSVIKIVLLSDKGTEGLNLRYVREVHVTEPWYHMNKIEQIVGRASRNCSSHASLPPDKRNVTVYLHVVHRDDDDKETVDLRAYRIAEQKQLRIAKVEAIMRDNAVDCAINYARLFLDRDVLQMNVDVTTSQRVQVHGYRIGDRPEMRPRCAVSSSVSTIPLDTSTYDVAVHAYHLHTYRRLVRDVFLHTHKATYDSIWMTVSSRLPDARRELAALALDEMVREGSAVTGPDGRGGRIVYRGDLYLFQPDDAKTTFLSEWERTHTPESQRVLVVPEKSDTSVSHRGSSSWTMDTLENLVSARIAQLGHGLPHKNKTTMQGPLLDAAIDRLSHDEILRGALALLVAETNGGLGSVTSLGRRIRSAMTAAGIISMDNASKGKGVVKSPFGGTYCYDPDLRVLRRCPDLHVPSAKDIDILQVAVASMQPVPRIQTAVFKMLTGGPRGGCVCHQTSTLTVQDMRRLIQLLSRSDSDAVPPGLNKRQMCMVYELLIRLYKPHTLVRPLQQSIIYAWNNKKKKMNMRRPQAPR